MGSDAAALALTLAAERVAQAAPHAWVRRAPGLLAFHSSVPTALANAVVVHSVDARPSVVDGLLRELAATHRPYRLQLRPPINPQLVDLAQQFGMIRTQGVPLMALSRLRHHPKKFPRGLRIRKLAAGDAQIHAQLAASGSEVPPALFMRVWNATALSLEGLRCYVAYLGETPVGTSIAFTIAESVVVLNVATLASCRRRGIGTELTAHALRDEFAAGAQWACLQSTPLGYGLYQRLGFRELEVWTEWVARSPRAGGNPAGALSDRRETL